MKWSDFLIVLCGEVCIRNKMFKNEFSWKIKSKSQTEGQEFKLVNMLQQISAEQPVKPAYSISSVCCYLTMLMTSSCFCGLYIKKRSVFCLRLQF